MAGNKNANEVLKRMTEDAKAKKAKPKAKHNTAPPTTVEAPVEAVVKIDPPTPVVAPQPNPVALPAPQDSAATVKDATGRSVGNKRGAWCGGRGFLANPDGNGRVVCPDCGGSYKARVIGSKASVPYHYAKKGRKAAQ